DAGGVGGLRMLADGTEAETQPGAKQEHLGAEQYQQCDVHHDVLLEEDAAEEWNRAQQWNVPVGQGIAGRNLADIGEAIKPVDEKHGNSRGEDVDSNATDDLVRAVTDRD